ncbi:TPA: helix-turn-helix domain-containing protein [Yersinia enterocolitica]|uniref:Transcriptional regulator n=1 Tax=Yersinia massiliensis TaxID=419257 RepID=A0ABM6USE9_9GAMM|nr:MULTISPECIES: helix-turn-helix transcriptional regulator [Yersinia]AVX37798.1 transcriptional regulator [Yersinia massiliensis]EKN3387799.1 helix-turn-helix domain-containing protein [Yersinia enterocolitica]EKN3589025.1 helix-turn-helix domain-containing protein [Yersinia enterocolitica]EKN3769566.1 helix-turn-helix domain-containing protein [Yersinia enterocolitica]EKN4084633.1 helix-turn-helix domain-containing protein [Yersinia enterocolitica]
MNLNDYLKQNGISQADYAVAAGVTQGFVSQVIAGRYKPKGRKAIQWSEATNWAVTPHELNSDDYPNKTDGLPTNQLNAA